mmetsp:Transcript_32625/g.64969  ORF Transcript_32625/g.64969 Transcript_32625/m.64969 type:complete len:95 (+) Transcript_32625:490-774(+)
MLASYPVPETAPDSVHLDGHCRLSLKLNGSFASNVLVSEVHAPWTAGSLALGHLKACVDADLVVHCKMPPHAQYDAFTSHPTPNVRSLLRTPVH